MGRSYHHFAGLVNYIITHSRVKTAIVPNTRKYRLHAEVHDAVRHGATVYSDELKSYDDLDATYVRDAINHAETYVRGSVHTNGMENFWSLLKRTLKGTYVSVEPFHLFRYLDEQVFRFNSRKATDSARFQGLARPLGRAPPHLRPPDGQARLHTRVNRETTSATRKNRSLT